MSPLSTDSSVQTLFIDPLSCSDDSHARSVMHLSPTDDDVVFHRETEAGNDSAPDGSARARMAHSDVELRT